jgi:histidinol-phosphate aminotransferase
MDLTHLARPELLALTAYSSARKEGALGEIWLNANENPWPSEPEYLQLNRYPEPQPQALVQLFKTLYQVSSEQLLITRGSDEGIDLLMRAFCRADVDHIIQTPPTYGMYEISATIQGAHTRNVPLLLEKDFALDTQTIINNTNDHTKLIFICNPNNPTANDLSEQQILHLCEALAQRALIVVDEAYVEFSRHRSLSQHLSTHTNLVILRTLSKAYGLAGARCGAVLAHPAIISLLNQIIAPYPIPKPVVQCVLQAMTREWIEERQQQIAIIRAEREKLMAVLIESPHILHVWPSETNFILCRVHDPNRFMQHFSEQGIVIRDRSHIIDDCIRMTVGTPAENLKLITALSAHPIR